MNKEPRILIGETIGRNNEDLEESVLRVEKSKMYEDQSTIIICPTRGTFPTRVVQSWMKLMKPMNQQVAGPIFAECMKVDEAYEMLIEYILGNEHLNKYKYVLTIEEDNLPPSDGLLRLYESMGDFDVVGGLYWGKGENGFPMIYGNPEEGTEDFKPQTPKAGEVQEANGLGMGFNLFKLDMFRHIERPWFKTIQEKRKDGGDTGLTQDMFFYRKAKEAGYKFACDNKILVGHYDVRQDIVY